MADKKKIKAFVQEVLGCGCSEEVFRTIETDERQVAGTDCMRINIGNRLLVYLVDTDDAAFVGKELRCMVAAGKEDRDAGGFNRFRLVLATGNVVPIGKVARKAFEAAEIDDKVHLHVIPGRSIDFSE